MTPTSALLVDSHCHLDFPDFGPDRADVLARARRAGVGTLLTICTKVTEFPPILALAESDPDIWCSVGIHPHEAEHQPRVDVDRLLTLAAHPKVVAIGECGLDYYYEESPRTVQQAVFETHLTAAREGGLPIIVHTRDADPDMAGMLTAAARPGGLSGVLHCFTSGLDLARHALDLGFYISISGIVTFKNAENVREAARLVPLDRLLVETDAPYLAPVPVRGKRNEPAYVAHTAAYVAALKGVSLDCLTAATTENFFRLMPKARVGG